MHPKLNGVYVALTTPFDHAGNLYRVKVSHNVSRLNDVALSGYVVGGSTGESPFLSFNERVQLFGWVRETAKEGRQLIAGISAESVRESVDLANCAADLGYAAALVLGPRYYKKWSQLSDTQSLFYRSIADQAKLPILLYNFPNVTGYDLAIETIAALAQHPNIAGMKDSLGDVAKLADTVKAVGKDFPVLSGSGTTFYPALQAGATGAILAFGNCAPYACVTIWEAFRTREWEAAEDWQKRIHEAAKLVTAEYGIAGLKYAMDLNGFYGGPPRLPLSLPTAEARTAIERAMDGIKS